MLKLLSKDTGSAMVTAIVLTMILLSIGMTTLTLVDTSRKDTARERQRESSFTLAEGVLNTQIFLLSRAWPATAATAHPASCSKATEADRRCPSEAALLKTFTAADYTNGITWTTEVHDNTTGSAESYYDDIIVRAQPTWDANQDTYMWVRARGILPNGKSRTLVALVKAELLPTNFPRAAVVAGSLDITQSGNHTYIDTDGANGTEAGAVILRCDVTQTACADWDAKKGQIAPQQPQANVSQPSALSSDVIERLRETARMQGTYSPAGTCPATLTGSIVFIENANCSFNPPGNSSVTYNSSSSPGVVVIGAGQFELQGNSTYYGLIYHVNGSDGYPGNTPLSYPTPAVTISSGAVVYGAVIIDGSGHIEIGNNSGGSQINGNIVYDPKVFTSLRAYGTAGIVQNSFRELPGSNTN